MNKLCYILLFLFLVFFVPQSKAQTTNSNEVADNPKGVVMYTDPRLAIALKKDKAIHQSQDRGSIRSGKGFRVQIYNGNDRSKATSIRLDFMRRFPGVRTYLTYISPHFRVKVGDYTNRQEAQKMYHQVSEIYNPCMIVPDFIVINTVKAPANDQ